MTTKLTGCCAVRIERHLSCRMMSELSRRTFLTAVAVGALREAQARQRAASRDDRPGRSQTAPTAKLKLGVCTGDIVGAVKYGFDYIEPAAADIAGMSEDKF